MPRNVYSEINLHITWHTKSRTAVIVDEIERQLFLFIQRKIAEASEGLELHAIGGTADHVHLAVSVPPTLNVSEWIGQIKGASAHYINHRIANCGLLEWQTGYGVVSFGTKGLPWVVAYIRNQKEHHACGSTRERLERVERMEARERAEPDFSGGLSVAFLTVWRGEVRERPVSTRRAPLDDPHLINEAYLAVRRARRASATK